MKILLLTTKTFPSSNADHLYMKWFAEALTQQIGSDLQVTVNEILPGGLKVSNVLALHLGRHKRALKFFLKFPSLHKKAETRIYVSNDPYIILILGFFNFFYRDFFVFYNCHGLWRDRKHLMKWVVRSSDFIFCNTEPIREALITSFQKDPDSVIVSPCGVDLATFDIETTSRDARKALGLPEDKIIIGYTGRFKTEGMEKGIREALETLRILDDRFFLIAAGGRAQEVEEYKALAASLSVEQRAIFIGNCTQDTLALYQKASDVLIMPFPAIEHYAYDMSPIKMFEYMSSKRPIIASNLPSVQSVLNVTNSILVEPGNISALQNAIKRIATDEAFAKRIAQQAFEDVQEYTWEAKARKFIDFVNRSIKGVV